MQAHATSCVGEQLPELPSNAFAARYCESRWDDRTLTDDAPFGDEVSSSGITLSGSNGLSGSLLSSNAKEEQDVIELLASRARFADAVTREEKVERDKDKRAETGLAEIRNALAQSEEFKTKGKATLTALANISKHYEMVTSRQEKMEIRARSLHDDVARSQMSFAMSQLADYELSGTNEKVTESQSKAKDAREAVMHKLRVAMGVCHQRSKDSQFEAEYLERCKSLTPAYDSVDSLYQSMAALFNQLDMAFKMAHAKSAELISRVEMPQ